MRVVLKINKRDVYEEVGRLTSYTGAKMPGNAGGAYDLIFTTEDDNAMLDRFWIESWNELVNGLKKFIMDANSPMEDREIYSISFLMAPTSDEKLYGTIEEYLIFFYVFSISYRWFIFSNKDDVEYYRHQAAGKLNEIRAMLYYKKKPVRVTPKRN